MKKLFTALFCCCSTLAWAQTAEELISDGKNTENVTTFGMGYDLKRTWARETRLEREQKGLKGLTPQLTGKYTPPPQT